MSATLRWAALAVIAVLLAWSVHAYAGLFGGDPEIHIIFARNLLRGYPLQFNPGDFSSGETSPLYMLLVAALNLVMGAYVPLGMKLVGVLSLAGLCMSIGREAQRQGASRPMVLLLGALPLLLPSAIFQALLGMENMLFACLVVLVLQAWLDGRHRSATAMLGMPLLFLLRPEAMLLGICLAGLALAERDGRGFAFLMLGAVLALAELIAITQWTGVPLEAAGLVRAVFSRFDSVLLTVLGVPVWLDFKFAPFLLYCMPFAAVAWLHRKPIAEMRSEAIIFVALFCLPLLLHLLTVFPSTHFSRYFLYGYAVFFFLFARLMARAEVSQTGLPVLLPVRLQVSAAVGVLAVTLVPYEHMLRAALPPSTMAPAIEEMMPAFVRRNSDTLYEALGRPPLPVVIALQEVQVRGRLDERFIVRSLDGVVDYRLVDFVHDSAVDYGGYLEARKVTFVFDPLPESSGVCLQRKALVPVPPAGPSEVYLVLKARGC